MTRKTKKPTVIVQEISWRDYSGIVYASDETEDENTGYHDSATSCVRLCIEGGNDVPAYIHGTKPMQAPKLDAETVLATTKFDIGCREWDELLDVDGLQTYLDLWTASHKPIDSPEEDETVHVTLAGLEDDVQAMIKQEQAATPPETESE